MAVASPPPAKLLTNDSVVASPPGPATHRTADRRTDRYREIFLPAEFRSRLVPRRFQQRCGDGLVRFPRCLERDRAAQRELRIYRDVHANATFAGSDTWRDYSVEAYLRPENIGGSRRGTALLARVIDANHFYQIEFANERDGNRWELWRNDGGKYVNLANGIYPYVADKQYLVQLTTFGSTISVSIADTYERAFAELARVTDTTYAHGRIGLRIWGGMQSTFDDVRVWQPSGAAPTPTVAATASPVRSAPQAVANGAIAPAGTQPFPNSPFDVAVSDPQDVPGSSGMIGLALAGNDHSLGQMQFSTNASGPTDGAAPVYVAHESDPHYRIHCRYYSGCPLEGVDVAIPRGARPAGNLGYLRFRDDGSHDQHLAIRNVDTQLETDMWLAPQPSDTGGTLEIGYGGSFPFSSGGVGRGGATASGFALGQGRIRPVDLIAGHLPTALALVTPCANGFVAPANNGDGASAGCPPLGAHVWLDSSPNDIANSGASPDVRVILNAMHEYGGYIGDRCSVCSLTVALEGGLAYTAMGLANPWAQIAAMHPNETTAAPQGGIPEYHIAVDSGTIDLAHHLHVIR